MNFKQILKGLGAAALATFVAANTAGGIYYDTIEALVVAVLLLSFFNVFLKPLLMLFSLPFIVLTFGLGIWIINAVLFLLVGSIVNGFYVESFASALWGAFLLSVINLIATIYFGDPKNRQFRFEVSRSGRTVNSAQFARKSNSQRRSRVPIKEDDVIDV